MPPSDPLCALLSRDEMSWLVLRLTTRLERGLPLDRGSVSLVSPDEAQRRAVDDLLGRRSSRGTKVTVDLGTLCRKLERSGDELRDLVVSICGPIDNRLAARQAEAAAWNALFGDWKESLANEPELSSWLDEFLEGGYLKRAAKGRPEDADRLLSAAHEILASAPHGDILLPSLAASVTGDSHALDPGRPLAHLCLRAILRLHGVDGASGSAARREAWSLLGVVVDDVSAPALCLNLRPAPRSEQHVWIDWHVQRGEPFYLSWRQARRFVPHPDTETVFVCENPAIVSEAARRLGPSSRPLLCTNGVPSGSVRRVLDRLRRQDVSLRLRADFDWAGLRILDLLHEPGATRLWRMSVDDYRRCRPTQALTGSPFVPAWGGPLAAELAKTNLAAYEEELVETLISDLAAAAEERIDSGP